MSADEVLASNLWPWPDPLLKRDQSGLVLFVNAAFLQLYGGRVEDWCGKPLAGWPEPVAAGAQRFETRIGVAPGENIYDWVESAMADGNALAIARNVTIFMAPAKQLAENVIPATPATLVEPPVASTPVPPAALAAPDISSEFQDTLNKRADEFAYDDNKTEQATPASAVVAPPVADQISMEAAAQEPVDLAQPPKPTLAHADEIKEETRMMERRALPIKDSTTVLGTNWRDEVIAKAVGGPAPEKETAQDAYDDKVDGSASKLGEGLQILLAEDNAINALLTRTLLEAEGAAVDTVEDGALALEAVNKKKYDLIFMDMRMPNMDGLEATRKIRALGSTIPIIALTANAFDDDRNACFDSGMNDFMTKPVSAEELSEIVVNWTKSDEEKKRAS